MAWETLLPTLFLGQGLLFDRSRASLLVKAEGRYANRKWMGTKARDEKGRGGTGGEGKEWEVGSTLGE